MNCYLRILKKSKFSHVKMHCSIKFKLQLGCITFGRKTYGMESKFLFASESGHSADLVFEYIHQLKLYIRSDEVEVNEIVDLGFLKKIDSDYMIIDYFFLFFKL